MSSAQSAASAAFKSSYQPLAPAGHSKPNLRLLIDNGSRTSLAAAQTSQQRLQSKAGTPVAGRPARSPILGYGPKLAQPMARARRSNASEEPETDYFNLLRGSVSSDPHGPPPRSRTISTNPQDMLEQVRQLINSKSKSGVMKDASRRSQAAIDEFRNSVDQRRLMSQLNFDVSSVADYGANESHSVYNHSPVNNLLRSSIGLAVSESNDELLVPPLIKLMHTSNLDSEPAGSRKPLNTSLSPPILIPPSPNALARAVDFPDNNIPMQLLLSSITNLGEIENREFKGRDSLEVKTPDEVRPKTRRKPPPDFPSEDDVSLSGHSLTNVPSSDADDTDNQPKLPIFPEIEEKPKKHKSIFRRSKQKFDAPPIALDHESDDERDFIPSRSATPVITLPQVKLKTTMRKVNKRREKKTAFNEDKPWKNHNDLDYVSELQRKRYEGLWVSNKGLYMNKALTRFLGVNYARDTKHDVDLDKLQLSEKEISQKAAKLSSKTANYVDVNESDIQQLHSLTDVDVYELIHGVVVRRIWNRSKLSQEVLESIWELVDFRRDGTLNKAEFIVGTWLVDQCLYGRKLPKEVGELVWSSLGNIGVRVVIKKKRR